MTTEIQGVGTKVAVGLGSGAGASVVSVATKVESFLPTDLSGWMAVAASGMAVGYTATIWFEWWWKRFWKPMLQRYGWLQ